MAAVKENKSAGRPAKKKVETKDAYEVLDNNGEVSKLLKENGVTNEHLAHMSVQQIDNISLGLSNNLDLIEDVQVNGMLDDEYDVNHNPLLDIGIAVKLPKVRAKYPDKVHLFWASCAPTTAYPIATLRANGCSVATVNDLEESFAYISSVSNDPNLIQVHEMVLMKTNKRAWEDMMSYYHHSLPAQHQRDMLPSNGLSGGMDEKSAREDALNLSKSGSLYGMAQKVKKPTSGSWTHIAE